MSHNKHNTTCAACQSRINPYDSDAASCCESCKDWFCTECLKHVEADYGDDICETCYDELNPAELGERNPYQNAFTALDEYYYSLDQNNENYALRIYDPNKDICPDKVHATHVVYMEYSSEFFTLMQYFYKWQRGQKDKYKKAL